jgi:hypothetical protein
MKRQVLARLRRIDRLCHHASLLSRKLQNVARPRKRRAAEQRDELASSQFIELHSIPSIQGRFAGYRMGRDQSAGLGALADCMLQRTLFQCPNFIY